MNDQPLYPPTRDNLARRFEAALQSGESGELRRWLIHEDSLFAECAVEVIRVDVVHGWQGGREKLIEAYLIEFSDIPFSDEQVLSLIEEEFAARQKTAKGVSIDEYFERFPQFAMQLASRFATEPRGAEMTRSFPSFSIDTVVSNDGADTEPFPRSILTRDEERGRPEIPGYEILEHLASGGMGAVFRARDLTLQREVAIKSPHAGFFSSDAVKERFLREARASAKLTHANICPVHEVREAHGRPYICMALIQGVTLRVWAASSLPGPRRVAEMVACIARAVQYAHDQGVVHRDLKPSNVMVRERDEAPVLMDFGLAKDLSQADGLTVSGDVLGTPAYMAPEQASGRTNEQGPLSDVYSLGAILYELLAGRPPFQGAIVEVLQLVLHAEPDSLRTLNRTVHPDLETICHKAMAKRPADRYASAGEFADDLTRFAAGEPIQARRPSLSRQALRWIGRRSRALLVAALVLIGGGMLATAIPLLSRSTKLSQLSNALQADLADPEWTIERLPQADQLLTEIVEIAPEQREVVARQIGARVLLYAQEQLEQGRLNDDDWQRIDEVLEVLAQRDPEAASALQLDADRRRGLWQRVFYLQAPFSQPVPELPGLQPDSAQSQLRVSNYHSASPGSESAFESLQPSTSRTQVEAHFHLPAQGRCGITLNFRNSHEGGIMAVAVAPDGKRFASATWSGDFIMLWNVESGDPIAALAGGGHRIYSLDFSPDGRMLAVYSADEIVSVWDITRQTILHKLPIVHRPHMTRAVTPPSPTVRFSADGARLVASCTNAEQGGEVRVWSVPSFEAQPSLVGPSAGILGLAVSSRGDRLAAGTVDGELLWWDLHANKLLWKVNVAPLALETIALAPKGDSIATAGPSGEIHIRDAQGRLTHSLQGYQGGVCSLAFSPQADGRLLACGYGNGGVMVWDTVKRTQSSFLSIRGLMHAVAYDPQGRWIIGGTLGGKLLLWDQNSVHARTSFGRQSYAFHVRRLPAAGRVVCEVSRNGAMLRQEEQEVAGERVSLVVRRDGDALRMQVNQNAAITFQDVFPPQPIVSGVWGLVLSGETGLERLIVRQAADTQELSSLEQGETLLRSGRFIQALAFFDEQILASVGADKVEERREAQVRAAQCLIHENRSEEAIQRLEQVAAGNVNDASPWPLVARFELWLLLMRLQRYEAADNLFTVIRATHSAESVSMAISAETRALIYDEYVNAVSQRKSVFRPDALARIDATLAVAEYFRLPEDINQPVLSQRLACLRMLGRNDEAAGAAQRIVAFLESPLQQRYATENQGTPAHLTAAIGLAYRLAGKASLFETRLETRLGAPVTKNSDCDLLPATLERARLHASKSEWPQALICLEALTAHAEFPQALPALRISTYLLHGFVLHHLNRPDDAKQIWAIGCDALQLSRVLESDFAEGGIVEVEVLVQMFVLAAVADRLSDNDVQRCFAHVSKRGEALGAASQVVRILPAPNAELMGVWRTPRGLQIAEAIARFDLTYSEQLQQFLMLTALQYVRLGAWNADPTSAEEDLIWRVSEHSFRAYLSDSLSIAAFLQLGLAWKGIPPPLGWEFCFSGVPEDIRGGAAYFLAKRMQKRGKAADHQTLMKLAEKWSQHDEALRELAAAAQTNP